MPIRLNAPHVEKECTPADGVVVRYHEASAIDVARALRASSTLDGPPDLDRMFAEIAARSIVAVTGFEDANGTPVVWPEKLADRLLIIEALPLDVLDTILRRVTERASEAAASGKG